MGRLTTGLWSTKDTNEPDEAGWWWLDLKQAKSWKLTHSRYGTYWRPMDHKASKVRERAAVLRHEGGERLRPEDERIYESAIEQIGGWLPDAMTQGLDDLTDADREHGITKVDDEYQYPRRPEPETEEDGDEVMAAFLGCDPREVDDVLEEMSPDQPDTKPDIMEAMVPVGSNTCPALQGAGKPRRFGRLHHRVAYVAKAGTRVVVAWKQGYARGSQPEIETLALQYAKSLAEAA